MHNLLLAPFSLLTALQQSAEAQEPIVQPQKVCVKADRANAFEFSSNYVGGGFDPTPNMCSQVWIRKKTKTSAISKLNQWPNSQFNSRLFLYCDFRLLLTWLNLTNIRA